MKHKDWQENVQIRTIKGVEHNNHKILPKTYPWGFESATAHTFWVGEVKHLLFSHIRYFFYYWMVISYLFYFSLYYVYIIPFSLSFFRFDDTCGWAVLVISSMFLIITINIHIFMTKLGSFFTCFIFFNKEYSLILIIGGKIRKKS